MTSHDYTNMMFSPDDFAHLKIPLKNILSATNNFDDKRICGKDAFETYYQVQLLWSGEIINIYAGRLNKERFDGDQQFWTEVSILSSLKHKNLVSFVGFCDENDEKVTIIKRETRGSLQLHLSDPMLLTWVRRLEISVGIAQALSYIHYDESRDFSVIHRNIESSLIYLNADWEPKLGDFICSMKIKASERHQSFNTNEVRSTDGYTDPTYIETKSVSHKSDMYSFGIVMFELMCGRESVIANDYNKYLAPVAITHYREKKLDEIIDWGLRQQMDSQSPNMFAEIAYDCLKEERSQRPDVDEIVPRLVKALELARENMPIMSSPRDDLAHLKIPLENILPATNNFADENVIESAAFGNIYKGQLSWSGELINVNARRINKERKQAEQEFWMEISMLASLKHKNLVSLVGFCDENDEKVIINRNETRGWLDEYLSDPMSLTWVRRLEICVGLAHALSYIHYDKQRDFSVIHRNIRSGTVQLNDDWEPKLSAFQGSMKIEALQRHHSFHTSRLVYAKGYGDPTYIETKSVNHKSDMYSFGILLFEVLCGRRSIISNDINKYLAPLAITHYREKSLNEIIDFNLLKQMHTQSLNIFAEIAYDCLNEERSLRPSIDEIVTRLEKALELQLKHQNATMSSLQDDLAHLKIPLESILSATNNFDDKNAIITSALGNSYKGQLLWSGELFNINARRFNKESNVAEQEFRTEISMLSSLKHKNLVSLVGFCDEKDEKIIITKYDETRGMLFQYLSNSMSLTWVRRLEISVGLAHALSYIHHDEPRNFSVIHRKIASSTVQLNDGWEPKLSNFECSMKIEASQRHHSFHTYIPLYLEGCGDPTYIETNSVNHKSDMYSFGIVLCELLCGRRSIIDNKDDNHLAPLAITHYIEKTLNNLIDPELWKQMDLNSFNMFAKITFECLDKERSRRPNIDDIVPRLEKALKLARENRPIHSSPNHLAHLRIPFEDIESATNYFDDKNVVGTIGFGKRYKGQLSWSGELIDITARRLINKEWDELQQQFWTEISMLSSLKHKNLVPIVGFCNEVGAETIIYKHDSRGRLGYYLSDRMLLTWVKILEISVGVAHALSYIHYDEPRDFSVIHRNITSDTVRLNDNWEPKLSEFQHSMKIKASERHHSFHTDSVWSMKGYTDPIYVETSSVNHKSDIYSFGIVLFELLCGRNSVSDDQDNKYLAPVAIFHYREKILDGIIDPDLRKQMNPKSLNIYAEIAYECLNEEQSQRPNMDLIVTRLEKALKLQLECENAVQSSVVDEVGGTSFSHEKGSASHFTSTGVESNSTKKTISSLKYLSHSQFSFKDIESATNNFAPENEIRDDETFKYVYQGRMLHSGQFIDIVARGIYPKYRKDESKKFRMEKSMLSSLSHTNLVSVIGFCDEEMITVYKKEANGSLNKYLSDETLTWMRRLKICLGVANALSYIHYDDGRDFSVIHRNIRSSKILLDDKWEPKLSGFELGLKNTVARRHRLLLTRNIVKNAYMDPKYKRTGGLTHKSDVYPFGVVLFEVLCGRSAVIPDEELEEGLLSRLAKSHLDDMIDPRLRKQMDPEAFKIFSETAHYCIQEERGKRPDIDQVVKRLKKALEHQWKHENPNPVNRTSSIQLKGSASHFTSTGVESNSSKKTMSSLKYISHSQLSFKDIQSATNNFAPENKIRDGETVKYVYQGRMLHSGQSIDIVARGIYPIYKNDESKKFRMQKSMLSSLSHTNLVSIIGFCDEEIITVYKKEANGSLNKHLSDETLTWMQRLKICLGVANVLSYIHYDVGRDFSVIHCNIRSSKILLDDKWEPKLSGFEHALKNTIARRHRFFLTHDVIENVYLDPQYKQTGGLTHKSDVYSFGVVLFEVLCGMSAIDEGEGKDKDEDEDEDEEDDDDNELGEGLLSKLAKYHLDEMIMPHLRNQMDPESLKIFSETAYYCIKEDRAERPYIDQVVKRLKKALELQWKHENPVNLTSSNQFEGKNLEHLMTGLNDIIEATKNFDDAYCIGSGGFGKVYKADLEHFDSSVSSSIEGVDKFDLPKKRSTVAIKRINNQGGEQGFIAEIETLTTCKHDNIISLLGFCFEGNRSMILVYEHASKGSLEHYLGNSDTVTNLTWVRRVKICLDIAQGLNYIHNNTDHGKQKMIHRDIKSDNILLGDNWEAKIADFGLSKFHPVNQTASTIYTNIIAGTYVYLDPEYQKHGRLNKKSDIYSFGVVLLEILSGRLAYDSVYTKVNEKGIAPIARDHFKKGTIMEIVDQKIKEETDEHVFSLSKGPNKESLDIFLEIAFRCVAETQVQRPTIEVVIRELKKALKCQENHKDNLKLSLKDVKLAMQDFSQENIIGHGDFGNVYRGEVTHAHGCNIIVAKRFDRKSVAEDDEFMTELEILMEYKHENVIGLEGYCDEEDEEVIVCEYASRGSLDKYLSDDSLTWVMRLKICIDIATGLEFLHRTVSSRGMVIHGNITSSNILLFHDWNAKIAGFGHSLVCPIDQNADYVINNVTGTIGYRDPLHLKTGFLTKESDIFSMGAVLFDILCGKLSSEELDDEYLYLPFVAKHHYHVGKHDKLVFEGIKEQIVPQSYTTFTRIAFQCLHHRRERRPTADEVVIQLKKSLEFQEDHEKWEPKLPKDYKEIIQMSKCPEIYSSIKKKDLYNIFSKGILLQQDKVLLSFDGYGDRNKLVSAAIFSYINSCPHEWKSLQESRFGTIVEMFDISKLNIKIKTNAQLLSPNVVYGVYLVFKLSDSRQFSSKPMYVNLKYRNGLKSLHAYFATWKDKDWMMIELYQFLNLNEDIVFDFLLESFSSYHCGDGSVYVEGIEFRAIDEVKHKERKLKEVQQVLKSNFNVDQLQQLPANFEEIFKIYRNYDELFWLGEVNEKKLLVLSAKAVLYKFSNVDLFTLKPLAESRFQEVIELLPQQVFHLNCTIKSQMLSQDTEYVCYLVFKLSEKCHGLHCPVKVRDVLHKENNDAEFVYFITPSALNINDITRVPKQREDGWMEIQLWKFNSAHELKDGSLSIDMKFTSHEGPMSGLIICGLEFRPMFFGNSDDSQRQREKKMMLQDEAQNPHIQPKKDEKMTELCNC